MDPVSKTATPRPICPARTASRALLVVLGALCVHGCASLAPPASRPNVLVIIADDLGWGDIGALGSEIPVEALRFSLNLGEITRESRAADALVLVGFLGFEILLF